MIQIGSTVEYVNTKGNRSVGLVVATSETLTPGTELSENYPLAEGQVNLVVFAATGVHYPRYQVPSFALVEQWKAQGNTDYQDGGYWRPLEG